MSDLEYTAKSLMVGRENKHFKTIEEYCSHSFQAIIVLLLIGLVLTIPVAVLVFLYNLKSGFRAVEIDDDEEGDFHIVLLNHSMSKSTMTK